MFQAMPHAPNTGVGFFIYRGKVTYKALFESSSGRAISVGDKKILDIEIGSKIHNNLDLQSNLWTPGFIDVHIHGAVGVDVNAAGLDGLLELAGFVARNGVTAWMPTLVPDSDENYARVIGIIDELMRVQESERLSQRIRQGSRIVVLDREAKPWSSEQLASRVDVWRQGGKPVGLVIGGSHGISPELVARADERWGLGSLTLPHELARVVVLEQCYRAWTILKGEKYHK